MKDIGLVGLGDMGSGMAGNLLRAGFNVHGYDRAPARLEWLEREGGHPAENAAAVGERSDAAFVMVLNGDQARDATLGAEGLAQGMQRGGVVLLSATIRPIEAEGIAADLREHGITLIDTPVSGGKHGADAGKLNLYPAGDPDAIDRVRPVLEAISKQIVVTGDRPGQGQVAKAALQALIGGVFAGVFEAAVFGSKAASPARPSSGSSPTATRAPPSSRTRSSGSWTVSSSAPAATSPRCTRTSASSWTWRARWGRRSSRWPRPTGCSRRGSPASPARTTGA